MQKHEDSNSYQSQNEQKEKKKQKAGLNAVRPDGFIEEKFKTMAKDNRLSQTEMFNRIFLSYLRDVKNWRRVTKYLQN